jgi:hypothetical protein
VKLLDSMFPFLVLVMGERADEAEVRSMDAAFRSLFARGQRYVLLNVPSKNQTSVAAKERKMITDWANQPHVQEGVSRCCAASSIVMTSAVARGALTAILWVWRPPVHLEIVADVPSGIGYLVDAARKADLPLPGTAEDLYRTLRPELEGAGALSAWGA